MLKFLRYGTRHRIYFPRGYNGKYFPQLDPTVSSSHGANRKRTFDIYEPLFLFRLRLRLFAFAGNHRCPERGEFGQFQQRDGDNRKNPDQWHIHPDGNRGCSFCGSMHFDDFKAAVKQCIETNGEAYSIEGTTKSYKMYVKKPGVINAGYGVIKFYMHHADMSKVTDKDNEMLAEAQRISNGRYQKIRDDRIAKMAEEHNCKGTA